MFRNTYAALPIEVLLLTFSHLTPEAASTHARLNLRSLEAGRDSALWRRKFRKHFPHLYHKILKSKPNANWYAEFKKAYQTEYEAMTVRQRNLFSCVKENDVEGLRRLGFRYSESPGINDLSARDSNERNLLTWAQQIGNQGMLNYIFSIIVTNLSREQFNKSIIFVALQCHQSWVDCQKIIDRGAVINCRWADQNRTSLHIAAKEGLLDVVTELLLLYPDMLNLLDDFEQSALVFAASRGHLSVVKLLLQQPNISLNAATQTFVLTENGNTALHWAATNGHTEIFFELVAANADLSLRAGLIQRHPIHTAAQHGRLEIVRRLLATNPELLNIQTARCNTPLGMAASEGHDEVVEYLLGIPGVDIHLAGQHNEDKELNGMTALHWAAREGYLTVFNLLVKAGCHLTLPAGDAGKQPLHYAAKAGHVHIVEAILTLQPDLLNSEDNFGQTALMWAASKGHLPLVKYLLAKPGINLDANTAMFAPEGSGFNAHLWSVNNGHEEVTKVIEEHCRRNMLPNKIYS